jgi:hypothetical protein
MEPVWSEWGINCHTEKLKLLMVEFDRPVGKVVLLNVCQSIYSSLVSKKNAISLLLMQALNSLNIKILSVFLVENNGGFKPVNVVVLMSM